MTDNRQAVADACIFALTAMPQSIWLALTALSCAIWAAYERSVQMGKGKKRGWVSEA